MSKYIGPPEQDAPSGAVWVCGACGKRASNRYSGGIAASWDESCMMYAVLCDITSLVIDPKTGLVIYGEDANLP